ncbi:MAG: hypothetical protein AAFO07_27410, partial [Bacteroidota bacterium]
MANTLGLRLQTKIKQLISQNRIQHIVFWFFFFIVLIAIESTQQSFWFAVSNEVINTFFYAILVYFNLFYLIPNYLTQKKFG